MPASTYLGDRSHERDQSVSGASMAGVTPPTSCSCCDQASVVGAALGADEIEQMINDKMALLLANKVESVDGKLATLHTDLRSWTQQFVMAELASKQQASDAQQLADRSADSSNYAKLVRSFISVKFYYCLVLSPGSCCINAVLMLRGF